uniref:Exostosin GT47 domain-containing protein n=1 Tax=Quercus lobata TaxID=97700 RepID=A0A7N2L0S6_QUELO
MNKSSTHKASSTREPHRDGEEVQGVDLQRRRATFGPRWATEPCIRHTAIEGQFIDEIERDKSPFRASHPEEAHVFFMPFSIFNIVKYIYMPITAQTDYYRDRLQRIVTDYNKIVADKHPYWNRSSGADHFMLSCHDWLAVGHGAVPGPGFREIRVEKRFGLERLSPTASHPMGWASSDLIRGPLGSYPGYPTMGFFCNLRVNLYKTDICPISLIPELLGMVDKAAEYGSVRVWAITLLGLGLRIFQEQLGLALKLLGPTIAPQNPATRLLGWKGGFWKLAGLPGIPFNPFVIYSCRLAVQDAPLMTSLYEANLHSATHLMRWGSGTDTPLFFRFLLET